MSGDGADRQSAWQAARAAEPLLAEAGVPEARFEAEYLARTAAGISRAQYFAGAPLDDDGRQRFEGFLERRIRREPSAYLAGEREFRTRTFAVGPGVLVPRPETEMLVDIGLDAVRGGARTVLEVGTGSGAVAVSLAAELSPGDARVVATDLSARAILVARANARRHAAQVDFVLADLAGPIGRADVVLANLPYIPSGEIDALEPEVSRWEPRLALDGGDDGYALIRRLLQDCATRLRPRLLALEVGFGQAQDVAKLVHATRANAEVLVDFNAIERIVVARWP